MSRTFKHFPEENTCPLCNKNNDEECVLVPLYGTEEGHNVKAAPVHLSCAIEFVALYLKESMYNV